MRPLQFVLLALIAGCSDSDVPTIPMPAVVEPPNHTDESLRRPLPVSPFLPAVAAAGLLTPSNDMVLNAIEPCGSIVVGGLPYVVLYLDRHIEISPTNRRDASYWLICDTGMNPAWVNRDYGGRPGKCSDNQIVVALTDKTFEIDDDPAAVGDLLTFSTSGSRLRAALSWSSDEVRIACALNAEKWRTNSHEPDEDITKILRVPGHSSWRLVLTQYVLPCHQGCAKLVEFTTPAKSEFGVRERNILFSAQACRPTAAHLLPLPGSNAVLVVIDWETRGGWKYRDACVLLEHDAVFLEESGSR